MTRTDQLTAAVTRMLRAHQEWLDAMPSLRALTIDVKLYQKTGKPRVVILRAETEHDAEADAPPTEKSA